MVIFHCYASSPEGNHVESQPLDPSNLQSSLRDQGRLDMEPQGLHLQLKSPHLAPQNEQGVTPQYDMIHG